LKYTDHLVPREFPRAACNSPQETTSLNKKDIGITHLIEKHLFMRAGLEGFRETLHLAFWTFPQLSRQYLQSRYQMKTSPRQCFWQLTCQKESPMPLRFLSERIFLVLIYPSRSSATRELVLRVVASAGPPLVA
jgi:hypothetical protein